ncbi:hypothetical protein [Allochromatium tepidum]|uniref:Transport-associated OB type 2 domain-containing protein n=1 Tax=Allochromatium tepidum TaxID=553982 RepID=A0ABN6GA70_9GAMM|nr:hypothetical protein [Allochromatium tepidum]BCU06846.1 hypothetical protein Atep_15230 [Allochromatium tepidum]
MMPITSADFIGQGTRLRGTVLDGCRVDTDLGELSCSRPHDLPSGTTVEVLVRPDDLIHDDASPIRAQILDRAFRSADFLYRLRLPSGSEVLSLALSHQRSTPSATGSASAPGRCGIWCCSVSRRSAYGR